MPRTRWIFLFHAAQALSTVLVAVLAFWAFFFSSLSQKLEENLRVDATLAKQELLAARQAKLELEADKSRLITSMSDLAEARDRLKSEITALEADRNALGNERSTYARLTRQEANLRYVAMVKYELGTTRKIVEICANYSQHRQWLAANRERAQLERRLEALPFEQRYDENQPINKRLAELDKFRFTAPEIWRGLPSMPMLSPREDVIALTAHDVKLLNTEDFEKLHSYLVEWLLERTRKDKNSAITGESFIASTKKYPFLDTLLPKERDELNLSLDRFLVSHPDMRNVQINALLSPKPSPEEISEAGRERLLQIMTFEKLYLGYLTESGFNGAESEAR